MAGAKLTKSGGTFTYPSYVHDIMGYGNSTIIICINCVRLFVVIFSHWDLAHSGKHMWLLVILMYYYYYWLRWVCTSALPTDLEVTDNIAVSILENIVKKGGRWTITGG